MTDYPLGIGGTRSASRAAAVSGESSDAAGLQSRFREAMEECRVIQPHEKATFPEAVRSLAANWPGRISGPLERVKRSFDRKLALHRK